MPALISERWRSAAAAAIALSVLVVAVLGVRLHDAGATSFDAWVLRRSMSSIGSGGARTLLDFSKPAVSLGVIVLVAALAAVARQWRLVLLAAAGPGIAVVLTEYVLKPLIDRYLVHPGLSVAVLRADFSGAFPSGHETGVASAAVLVFVAAGQLRVSAAARVAIAAVLAVWTGVAALGLTRNYYHYATDTVGALGVAVAVVLGGAWVIDAAVPALVRRRQLT